MKSPLGRLLASDPRKAVPFITKVYEESGGVIRYTAEKLGVAHTTLLRWVEKHKALHAALEEADRRLVGISK